MKKKSEILKSKEIKRKGMIAKEDCPQCSKRVLVEELISIGCPWCGWVSAKAKAVAG